MSKAEKPKEAPAAEAGAGGADKGKLKLILMIVGIVIVSMGIAGGGAWWYFSQQTGHEKKKEEDAKPEAKAIYIDMKPPFVVTLTETETGNLRYMQASATVVTRDPKIEEALKLHDPVIRNNLSMLFSGFQPAQLETAGGREELAKRALAEINTVIEHETKVKDACEAFLFTSFVIQ